MAGVLDFVSDDAKIPVGSHAFEAVTGVHEHRPFRKKKTILNLTNILLFLLEPIYARITFSVAYCGNGQSLYTQGSSIFFFLFRVHNLRADV